MNGTTPISVQFDAEMGPTTDDPQSPVGVNELVPHTERFIEMFNITPYRDGVYARDIALFNFTALHGPTGTRFKIAFWDLKVADVRTHKYRLQAIINFEPDTRR